MKKELKQFLRDRQRFQRGLPPEPVPPTGRERRELQRLAATIGPDFSNRIKTEMTRVARQQMLREVPQICAGCYNAGKGGKPVNPRLGCFSATGKGLYWKCHQCLDAEAATRAT